MAHQELASGKWAKLTLAQQLGNIGSEISRAIRWQSLDEERFTGALKRADELLILTISDPRWQGRRKELCRFKEVFLDAALGGREYSTTFKDLLRYCDAFALVARLKI